MNKRAHAARSLAISHPILNTKKTKYLNNLFTNLKQIEMSVKSFPRKMMLATDGSKHSIAAAEKGAQIAKTNNSEVIIVHVLQPYKHMTVAPGPMDFGARYQVETEDEVIAVGKEIITKTQKVFDDASVKASTRLLKGNVAEAIINEAINEEVDIIVVGATGHGGMMTWLLGSVAHKIARNAPCPVLIMR